MFPSLNKLSSLQQRILSALIMVPVFILVVVIGGFVFTLFMAIVAMIAANEWLALTGRGRPERLEYSFYASLAFPIFLTYLLGFSAGIVFLTIGFFVALFCVHFFHYKVYLFPPIACAAGVFYIGLPGLCIVWLRHHNVMAGNAPLWAGLISLCIMVWVTDTGAYFSGRTIGGPKLAPTISPKKTWAGLIGGILFTVVSAIILSVVVGWGGLIGLIIIGIIVPVIAQMGDLFESFIKRRAGLKDSGNIIPGHGGVLDRIDGLLFAAPIFTILALLFL